jgi:ribosomal protein L12E/L44/L45/RPP1/RPP2
MMTNEDSKKETLRRGLEALDAIEQQMKREELFRHIDELGLATDQDRFLDTLSELVQDDLENEMDALATQRAAVPQGAASDKPFARRIEELGRGIISMVAGTVAELQMQYMQAAPAAGFRQSKTLRKEEGAAQETEVGDTPEVVNWVPSNVSSTVVGCQVSLVWKGKEIPSVRPNLRVVYDEEPIQSEVISKDASTIEISIDQPKPSRFVIDVSDAGEYVINLYSS